MNAVDIDSVQVLRGPQGTLFGTNLTDTLYLVSGNVSGAFGLAEASDGRPREWGAGVGFRF